MRDIQLALCNLVQVLTSHNPLMWMPIPSRFGFAISAVQYPFLQSSPRPDNYTCTYIHTYTGRDVVDCIRYLAYVPSTHTCTTITTYHYYCYHLHMYVHAGRHVVDTRYLSTQTRDRIGTYIQLIASRCCHRPTSVLCTLNYVRTYGCT